MSALRDEAAGALSAFAEVVIADERPRILEEALQGGFWRSVGSSMAANFFYTLVLIGLAIVLTLSGVDVVGILERAAADSP